MKLSAWEYTQRVAWATLVVTVTYLGTRTLAAFVAAKYAEKVEA